MNEEISESELRNLIIGDPDALAFFGAGNDTQCAARCSQIATRKRPVTADEVQRVASFGGAWARIAIASQSQLATDEIRGLAITFREWVLRGYTLNFELPEVQSLTQTLVAAGLATQAEVDSLIALTDSNYTITPAQVGAVRQVYGSDLGGDE